MDFTSVYRSGLFDNKTFKPKSLTHEHYIPIERVNQFYFGTNQFNNKLNFLGLHKANLIKNINDNLYVKFSNLEEYIKYMADILDIQNNFNCCPYNYYNLIPNKLNQIYPLYHKLFETIDKFISFLEEKNTHESKLIIHCIKPNNLEGEILTTINFNQDIEMIIKFNKFVIYFVTNFTEDKKDFSLPFENTQDYHFKKIYDDICNKFLMESPEEFIISNIEKVCGSRDFAEILVKSYMKKKEYIYSIDSIASIILWKNERIQKEYIEKFMERYNHCVDNEKTYLNFEGINKFLLNINELDVENFEVKEQINEMYYQSMHELIFSYETLYKHSH